jgi:hypothetical protein
VVSDVKVRVYVGTGVVGSERSRVISFAREDWESMSEKDREEACIETMYELICWGHEELIP